MHVPVFPTPCAVTHALSYKYRPLHRAEPASRSGSSSFCTEPSPCLDADRRNLMPYTRSSSRPKPPKSRGRSAATHGASPKLRPKECREEKDRAQEEASRPEQRAKDHPICARPQRTRCRKPFEIFVESPTFQKFGTLAQGLHQLICEGLITVHSPLEVLALLITPTLSNPLTSPTLPFTMT